MKKKMSKKIMKKIDNFLIRLTAEVDKKLKESHDRTINTRNC